LTVRAAPISGACMWVHRYKSRPVRRTGASSHFFCDLRARRAKLLPGIRSFGDTMKTADVVSTDCDLNRRTVLKLGAGISAFAVASRGPVSAAVLANNNEIVALSARAAVDYVRRGELSAERYAQVLLDRYKAHTNLKTVTYIDEGRLLEDARQIDRARAQGAQLGPLAGLPMMLKDNINTVGFPTTAGTTFLRDYRPKTNAPLAEMLFKQGAILFAKSNMHELA